MKTMIKLTLIHSQKWVEFATFRFWRKPNTTGIISVDPTKIVAYRTTSPNKNSEAYKRDYPTFTEVTLVGRDIIYVKETPEQIEKLINS